MRPRPSIVLSSVVALIACTPEPTNVEKMKSVNAGLGEALTAFKQGDYNIYYDKKSSALSVIVLIEPSAELPDFSEYTIKNGICDTHSIMGLYHVLEEYVDPALRLLDGSGEMDLGIKLDTAEFLETNALRPIDKYDAKRFKDCNRLIPGFTDQIDDGVEYVKSSLPEWRGVYAERTGETSVAVQSDLRQDRVATARRENLANWDSMSDEERRYFTLGDKEVEDCVAAFIGGSAPDPSIASTTDVSDLCRSGLKQ